ncbi:hypothetical protein V8C86DRAFT_2784056 [Haematococcus lacustris]
MCAVSAVTRLGKVLLLAYCWQTAVCATSPPHTYSAVDSTELLRFHAGPRSLVHTAWFRLVYPLSQSLPIFSVAGEVIALRRWGPPRHLEQQCAVRNALSFQHSTWKWAGTSLFGQQRPGTLMASGCYPRMCPRLPSAMCQCMTTLVQARPWPKHT